MKCAWEQFLAILPDWLAKEVDECGKMLLQELRLRRGQPPELNFGTRSVWLNKTVSDADLNLIINTASRYSPWAASSISQGYITAPGGHRIGVCGEAVLKNGVMSGIRQVSSVMVRIARDFPGIGKAAAQYCGSILLIGPPGSGKTTLIRDMVRYISQFDQVGVVDERGELFPVGIDRGKRMDVLTGCPKDEGIVILLRTMGPQCIAVDEITSERDCDGLLKAAWCGVRLIATAHAASFDDLLRRQIYNPLIRQNVFDHILVLQRDKSWREEGIAI